jgi:hypothetical protein
VTVHLLDTNVLIALAWPQHIHHASAHQWFAGAGRRGWATCAMTQVGFMRISSNPKIIPDAVSPRDALAALARITRLTGHHFWPDDLQPTEAKVLGSLALVGHRQVGDAYLLALAQFKKGKLATFDRGLSTLISDPKQRDRHVFVLE